MNGTTRDAVRAEWTKLRTAPSTGWLLAAVVLSTVALGAATATAPCPGCVVDVARVSLTGVQVGQAVVAILAVQFIGGEYATGMVSTTLTATPRRTTVLLAKAAVLACAVAVSSAVAVVASVLASDLVGRAPVPPADEGLLLRASAGSVVYLVLIALLALGLGTTVRNPATAIGIVLGLLYALPILALAASDPEWQRRLRQVGPAAGLNIQATIGLDDLPIGPWEGMGVLAAWAAGALLLGGVLLWRRDA